MTEKIKAVLPHKLVAELTELERNYRGFSEKLREIRLRAGARSQILLGGQSMLLRTALTQEEIGDCVRLLCRGSLYAYRDTIGEGYIPLDGGVRVGLCGQARYEGGVLAGISDVTSLVFRIPHPVYGKNDDIYEEWKRGIGSGMLIFSPPGEGKTTALRALAKRIGSGKDARRVAVVDERCEFLPQEYLGCTVDLLRGYKRAQGIEIAMRTLNPEILMVDEIGGREEADAMVGMLRGGVPLIATAHAGSMEDIRSRPSLLPFLQLGIFECFVGLSLCGEERKIRVERSRSCVFSGLR